MFRQANSARGVWSHAARGIAGLVLAAGIASSAVAQSGQSVNKSYRTVSVSNDDRDIVVKLEGDEIVYLKINGKEVDPDSVIYLDDGMWVTSGETKVNLAEILSDLPKAPPPPSAIPALSARPVIGVNVGEPSRTLRLQLGLKEGDGIVITDVNEGMPAEKAGLVEGDIIVGIDGKRGLDLEQLRKQFDKRGVGNVVELQVIRRGKLRDFDVTLAPSAPMATPTPPRFPGVIVQGDRGGREFQVIEPGAIEYIMGDEERRAFVLRSQEAAEAFQRAQEERRLQIERSRRFPGEEAERELRFFTLPDAKVLHEGLEEALVELEVRLEEQSDELEIVIEELEVRLDEALEEAESQLQGGADAFEDKFSWAEDRFFDADERFEEIEERWEEIEMRFDEFEARFDEQELMMTRAFQAIERQMGRIAERLDRE